MTFQEFVNDCLCEHNKYRRLHGIKPLKYSPSLDKSAKIRANVIISEDNIEESLLQSPNDVGENKYQQRIIRLNKKKYHNSFENGISGSNVAKEWYGEITNYGFSTCRGDAKSFTQMLWKSTKEVGFGTANNKDKWVVVAHYRPKGNTQGEYKDNVLPVNDDSADRGFQEPCANGALNEAFGEDIRPYIDIIDNMRKYGLQSYVELPNVVVVGDQSSGKSSIVEVISGIQLPRGSGIVTRCPLELQLKKVFGQDWKAIISYKAMDDEQITKEIHDPEEVELFVREAQEDLCKTKKGVSKELITLRIESPTENAPDLTMIDLPGIARTAIEDQPLDICDQIRKIIRGHIENKNTVILCVISGDLDIAVNESVNIAREFDPTGIRTIGVITKPDMADVDHKHEILRMMNNEKIQLKKGFNLVKCRSSEELKKNVPLSEFMAAEMDFYENDDIYRDADMSRVGALNLSKKITEELVNVIKDTLPDLKSMIESYLKDAEATLNKLPPSIPQNDEDKRSYMMILASELVDKIKCFLYKGEIPGDTNYHHIWRTHFETFQKALQDKKAAAFNEEFSLDNLRKNIIKYRSKEISGFLNYNLFEDLLKKHIHTYKRDADKLINAIGMSILNHLNNLLISSISHLPSIEGDIKVILNSEYQNNVKIAEERIEFIFKQEDLVFTMDNVFDRKWDKIMKKVEEVRRCNYNLKATSTIIDNSQKMSDKLKCYLQIVHTRLEDYVPLAVMQCLLIQFHEDLKGQFFQYFSSQEVIPKSIESSTVSRQKRKLNDKITCLKKGKYELDNKYSLFRI